MVKQEMTRVDIYILGISKQKWTGMNKFNSDDRYIYYCGQESLRRNGAALIVNKSPKCSTWVQSKKWQNDLCSFLRWTIQHHSNSSLCLNHWCQKSWNRLVLWRCYDSWGCKESDTTEWLNWTDEDIQKLLELTPKKMCFSSEGIGMQR